MRKVAIMVDIKMITRDLYKLVKMLPILPEYIAIHGDPGIEYMRERFTGPDRFRKGAKTRNTGTGTLLPDTVLDILISSAQSAVLAGPGLIEGIKIKMFHGSRESS